MSDPMSPEAVMRRQRNIKKLRAATERINRSDWRPMDEAPRDGTPIIVCDNDDEMDMVHWDHSNAAWIGKAIGYFDDSGPTDRFIAWTPAPLPFHELQCARAAFRARKDKS